jgi:hypothetical protein
MVVVAVIGLILGLCAACRSRSQRFYALMMSHESRAMELMDNAPSVTDAEARRRFHARITWHEVMNAKYERAARYPWLPVEPDPPEPE